MKECRVQVADLKISSVPRMQCMHGCVHYKRSLACPPHCPDQEDVERLLGSYKDVVVVHDMIEYQNESELIARRNECHAELLKRERDLKRDGHCYAVAFSSGACAVCDDTWCRVSECKRRAMLRYPVCSLGIDLQHLMLDVMKLSKNDALSFWIPNLPQMFEKEELGRHVYMGLLLY